MLRDWRNNEAHNAPVNTAADVDAAIKVVMALYLYVTAFSITDLESAGHDMEARRDCPLYELPENDDTLYECVAEDSPEA
jgi:hypothetical protein